MVMKSLEVEEGHLSEYSPSLYGYGTSICLNGEQCEALGLKNIRAGQEVTIRATGIVNRSTEELEASDDSGGKDLSISIQLTAMDLTANGPANPARAARILYDKED